jgi:hypothetical protein
MGASKKVRTNELRSATGYPAVYGGTRRVELWRERPPLAS